MKTLNILFLLLLLGITACAQTRPVGQASVPTGPAFVKPAWLTDPSAGRPLHYPPYYQHPKD